MKRKLPLLLMLLFLAAAVLFCVLWQQTRNDDSDLELLAQASARTALDSFRKSESETMYWQGTADFRVFMQAYAMLTGEKEATNQFTCGEVYAALIFHAEESREQMDSLTAALELLSGDIYDENGFLRLTEFYNAVLR